MKNQYFVSVSDSSDTYSFFCDSREEAESQVLFYLSIGAVSVTFGVVGGERA